MANQIGNLLQIISLELMEDFNFFWRVIKKYAPTPAYCDPVVCRQEQNRQQQQLICGWSLVQMRPDSKFLTLEELSALSTDAHRPIILVNCKDADGYGCSGPGLRASSISNQTTFNQVELMFWVTTQVRTVLI